MTAWATIWASAGPEFHLAFIEVSFELVPLFVGNWPILVLSVGAAIHQPLLIVLDYVLLEDRDVSSGRLDVKMAAQPLR